MSKQIIFESQQDFENAVMDVIRKKLGVEVEYHDSHIQVQLIEKNCDLNEVPCFEQISAERNPDDRYY